MVFYTRDTEVIELGSSYLRIVGFTYIPIAIATAYIAVLRSIQLIRLTVIATVSALVFKTILGYGLIFGIGGLPALGVRGAAIGTAAGWTLELILLLVLVYAQKTPLAANPLTLFDFDMSFFVRVLKTALPAVANELFWSLGITTYNAIYAHIGTDAIAAINVNATIEELALSFSSGLGMPARCWWGIVSVRGKRMKPTKSFGGLSSLGCFLRSVWAGHSSFARRRGRAV